MEYNAHDRYTEESPYRANIFMYLIFVLQEVSIRLKNYHLTMWICTIPRIQRQQICCLFIKKLIPLIHKTYLHIYI